MPATRESKDGGYPIGQHILTFVAILGIAFALWLVVRLQSLVVLVAISIVFSAGLAPLVARIERCNLPGNRHIPRGLAIVLVYFLVFVLFLGALTLIIVPVVRAAIEFSKHLPGYLESLQTWLGGLHNRFPQVPDYAGLVSKAQSQLSQAGKYVIGSVGAVFGIFGGVVSVFTVAVLTFYMLLSFEGIKRSFLEMIPDKHDAKTSDILAKMAQAMGGWLRGMLLLSAIVGLTTSAAMWALGVPYAPVIGLVGAIGELIPMVGPFAAAVPALLITAFGPAWKVFAALVFFVLLSLVESNVLAPKIMQRQVGLPPMTTIIALISGGALLGIVGALLAVPIAAALRVLYYDAVAPAVRHKASTRE